jgi:hypothetical protein
VAALHEHLAHPSTADETVETEVAWSS